MSQALDPSALKLVDVAAIGRARTCTHGFPHGLGLTGVHEVVPAAYGDTTAAGGFAVAAGLASAARGAAIWITGPRQRLEHGTLSGRGLLSLGGKPGALIEVTAKRNVDALWACEEAMASAAASLVVAELEDADFTATRRLSLIAETRGIPAILILPHGRDGATASTARWQVSARPSAPNRHDARAPGHIRWRASLLRARNAPEAVGRAYDVELDDETLSLRLVSKLATGPAGTPQAAPASEAGWRKVG